MSSTDEGRDSVESGSHEEQDRPHPPRDEFDPEEAVYRASWNGRLHELIEIALEAAINSRPGEMGREPGPRVLATIHYFRTWEPAMSTDFEHLPPVGIPPGSSQMPESPEAEGESTAVPPDLSHAVGAWVFIASFAGIALAWSTALFAPWVGGLIGGLIAFLAGTLVIAARG